MVFGPIEISRVSRTRGAKQFRISYASTEALAEMLPVAEFGPEAGREARPRSRARERRATIEEDTALSSVCGRGAS